MKFSHNYLIYIFFIIIFLFFSVIFSSNGHSLKKAEIIKTTSSGKIELCLSCHNEAPDNAHKREIFGCSVCHLGNPLEGNIQKAHKGMIKNPGELKFVNNTCGQSGCHSDQVKWVKNSLMATNRGIISTLMYYWEETDNHNIDISIEDLKSKYLNSPAIDYFKKLCATCHHWIEKNTLPDFLAEKGGGCSSCHYLPVKDDNNEKQHPHISKKILMENCVRCHNRSGRIGLSYQGLMESEGYGTPYKNGETTDKTLNDGRFYHELTPDIHFAKGMVCIDCHTMKEVMGDGNRHAHMEEQLEVNCDTCHNNDEYLSKLLENKEKNWNTLPKINIIQKGKNFFLLGKQDNKEHPLNPPISQCKNKLHKNLSCQACHSPWVPQCYGCHVKADSSKKQLDKISKKETSPEWREFHSFIRYEDPILGVSQKKSENKEVVALVPG